MLLNVWGYLFFIYNANHNFLSLTHNDSSSSWDLLHNLHICNANSLIELSDLSMHQSWTPPTLVCYPMPLNWMHCQATPGCWDKQSSIKVLDIPTYLIPQANCFPHNSQLEISLYNLLSFGIYLTSKNFCKSCSRSDIRLRHRLSQPTIIGEKNALTD